MKKLKVLGLAAAAAGMVLLTSCLDGNNSYSLSNFAVVDFSSKAMRNLVYPSGDYPLYIASISNDAALEQGSCIFLNYTVDKDAAENANLGTAGFYTATSGGYSIIEQARMDMYEPDTAEVRPHELAFTDAQVFGYVETDQAKKLFVGANHAVVLTDQKNAFTLTCDANQEVETVDGKRVYTMFLRAVKLQDGKAPTLSGAEYRAFDAAYFYSMAKQKEEGNGKDMINFRIKYVKEFNSDTTAVKTWGESQIVSLAIPKES